MPLFKRNSKSTKEGDQTRLRTLKKARSLRTTDSYPSGKWDRDLESFKSGEGELLVSSSDDETDEEKCLPSEENGLQTAMFNFSKQKGKDINNISVTSGHRAWLSYWNNNEVTLVNRHGEIRKVIALDTIITDISFSMATKELWLCCRDNTIREREPPDSARVAFRTKRLPLSLCMLYDGSALVGMEFSITKFDLNGRVLQTIDTASVRLIYPERIRQCRDTGHIGIVDRNFRAWGGSGFPSVIVLQDDFTLIFKYSCLDHTNRFSSVQPGSCDNGREGSPIKTISKGINYSDSDICSSERPIDYGDSDKAEDYINISSPATTFNPRDMCFGPNGQTIIADYENKIVFRLNCTGEYQSRVLSNNVRPCVLSCGANGGLWIGCLGQTVKLVQI